MILISMEMGFMEYQGISQIKIMIRVFFFIIVITTVSCYNTSEQLIEDDKNLKLKNGVLYHFDKKFTGKLVYFYKDGHLKSEKEYKKGRLNGKVVKWHVDQSLAEERWYTKGIKTGTHKSWWINGKPKFEYHFNNKGLYQGNVTEWFKNGQIYKSFHFEQGKESGKQQLFEMDGKIRANYVTINGERFGLIGLKKCYTIKAGEDEIF